jgi:hypothetical protein
LNKRKKPQRREVDVLVDEKKLREKLKWVIFPFKNSGSVPANLIEQIIDAVNECEIVEIAEVPEETEAAENMA